MNQGVFLLRSGETAPVALEIAKKMVQLPPMELSALRIYMGKTLPQEFLSEETLELYYIKDEKKTKVDLIVTSTNSKFVPTGRSGISYFAPNWLFDSKDQRTIADNYNSHNAVIIEYDINAFDIREMERVVQSIEFYQNIRRPIFLLAANGFDQTQIPLIVKVLAKKYGLIALPPSSQGSKVSAENMAKIIEKTFEDEERQPIVQQSPATIWG